MRSRSASSEPGATFARCATRAGSMTSQQDDRMDRAVGRWLEEGASRAPDGLLGTTLTRTRATRQLPGWLSRATGTPALDLHVGRRPLGTATWVALGVALLAIL